MKHLIHKYELNKIDETKENQDTKVIFKCVRCDKKKIRGLGLYGELEKIK